MLQVDRKPLVKVREDGQVYLMLLSNHRVIVDTLPKAMERYIRNFWPRYYCIECLPADNRVTRGLTTMDRLLGNTHHNHNEKKISKEAHRIAVLKQERVERVYERLTGKHAGDEGRQHVEPDEY